jgi:PiT family inorganic phosphate transporter
MADVLIDNRTSPAPRAGAPKLDEKTHIGGVIAFFAALLGGLGFTFYELSKDIHGVGEVVAGGTFALLALALLVALGFEFVNGFHDTANAVATVIYTHSLPPLVAVVWSGFLNFLGVLTSTGAVAFGIVTLLPVELILNSGGHAGWDMIFALLLSAIVWNLATWAFGIPNSSSHALIGAILGVGLMNQWMAPAGAHVSGVDLGQVKKVFTALLVGPLIGFVGSFVLLWVMKTFVKSKHLYEEPKGVEPPPWWIRAILVLTCSGVSFAHGSNDGQKGMGLIMLILIGAAPTAYAINRSLEDSKTPAIVSAAKGAHDIYAKHAVGAPDMTLTDARRTVSDALADKKLDRPEVYGALSKITQEISDKVGAAGSLSRVDAKDSASLRNDMYMSSDATRLLGKTGVKFPDDEKAGLKTFQSKMEGATRFIPWWVKAAVAFALGLGTMVGWKRIVVTVGEKIGKTHLSYGQGAAAELVAALTIFAADHFGLPASTTHVLSSGVAGTMAANGSGLQASTLRNIALAWVTTLPATIALAAGLFWIFRHIFA